MRRHLSLTLIVLLLSASLAFAADVPPPSASSEVIEKKIREEARDQVLAQKPPEKTPIPVPETKGPQKEGKVLLRKVRLQPAKIGASPEAVLKLLDLETVQPLLARYEGREVAFAELKVLSRELELFYQSKGYFAVVRIPQQDFKNGEIILEVMISLMGNLEAEGGRYYRAGRLKSYWQIPKGKVMRLDKMQSSVQAMNENPDRAVKMGIRAGKEPGTSDVVLRMKDQFPMHAGFSFDNQGSRVSGKQRYGFTGRHNNLLSLDDVFLIGTSFGKDFGALFLQHLIPISSFGTRLVFGFSHAQVRPERDFKQFDINGISQTFSLMIRQKLRQTDAVTIDAFAGVDFKEKWTRTLGEITNWDRLRVLSTGVDMRFVDTTGYWSINPAFNLGLSPHGDGYELTSRRAESNFWKTSLSVDRQQRLPWDTRGVFHFEAQLSPNKLPPQEQLFLGGARSVRGYPESDYGADQGILTNLEYWIPLPVPANWEIPYAGMPLKQQIQFLAFLDHGYGKVHSQELGEKVGRNLFGTGAGVQIRFRKNVSARIEWAVPLGNSPITEGGNSQVHFRLQMDV